MDERDRYRRWTPPAGIAAQIASPEHVNHEMTPAPETVPEAFAQIGRRQKQVQETSANTLDQVQGLRTELGGRIDRLDGRVDELTSVSANVSGKMDVLTDVVQRSLDEQSQIRVRRVTASIDVERGADLATIDERKARRAFPRELGLKITALVGPPLAAALALLLQSKC